MEPMTMKQTIQSVELLTRNALQKDLHRDEVSEFYLDTFFLFLIFSSHMIYFQSLISLVSQIHQYIILAEEMLFFPEED